MAPCRRSGSDHPRHPRLSVPHRPEKPDAEPRGRPGRPCWGRRDSGWRVGRYPGCSYRGGAAPPIRPRPPHRPAPSAGRADPGARVVPVQVPQPGGTQEAHVALRNQQGRQTYVRPPGVCRAPAGRTRPTRTATSPVSLDDPFFRQLDVEVAVPAGVRFSTPSACTPSTSMLDHGDPADSATPGRSSGRPAAAPESAPFRVFSEPGGPGSRLPGRRPVPPPGGLRLDRREAQLAIRN